MQNPIRKNVVQHLISNSQKKWKAYYINLFIVCICFIVFILTLFTMIRDPQIGIWGSQNMDMSQSLTSKQKVNTLQTQNGNSNNQIKHVALTFDVGPNPEYTPILLDGLKEREVHATFFLLGKAVDENPDLVKRIYEEGHLIGNHSYDHVNLGHLCEDAACEQVIKTNEAIESITGYYPEYIRPPFGEWKENVDQDVTMIKVLWNVDPLDWATGNKDAVVQRVVTNCEDNDIILMHDASKSSVAAALEIIDILQKKGYEFVTVDALILD